MATLINDSLLSAFEQQIASGCINKELFQAQVQLMRDMCTAFDNTVADLQSQITLCCGDTGQAGNAEFEANDTNQISNRNTASVDVITISDAALTTAGLDTCTARVTGTIEMCLSVTRPNDEDTTISFNANRNISLLCDGVVVDTQTVSITPVTSQGGNFTLCGTGSFILTHDITNGNGCVYTLRADPVQTTNPPNTTVELTHNFIAQCS